MKASFLLTNTLNIKLVIFSLLSLIVFSCKSGETIADQGFIQKRKYQKGYHVNIKSPFNSNNNSVHLEKTAHESFTTSLRSSLPSNSVKQVLVNPVGKESKLDSETIYVKNRNKTKAVSFVGEDDVAEATASIDEAISVKTKTSLYLNKSQNQPQDYYSARRLSTISLLSFLFAIASLFILGIPFGAAAVVLGIIGIVQVEKNRDIYKGQGFAIAGLIIGLIAVIVVIAYLATIA